MVVYVCIDILREESQSPTSNHRSSILDGLERTDALLNCEKHAYIYLSLYVECFDLNVKSFTFVPRYYYWRVVVGSMLRGSLKIADEASFAALYQTTE